MNNTQFELRYRFAGGRLGKPIQIGATNRTKWLSREEAEAVAKTLRFPNAIEIVAVDGMTFHLVRR